VRKGKKAQTLKHWPGGSRGDLNDEEMSSEKGGTSQGVRDFGQIAMGREEFSKKEVS